MPRIKEIEGGMCLRCVSLTKSDFQAFYNGSAFTVVDKFINSLLIITYVVFC